MATRSARRASWSRSRSAGSRTGLVRSPGTAPATARRRVPATPGARRRCWRCAAVKGSGAPPEGGRLADRSGSGRSTGRSGAGPFRVGSGAVGAVGGDVSSRAAGVDGPSGGAGTAGAVAGRFLADAPGGPGAGTVSSRVTVGTGRIGDGGSGSDGATAEPPWEAGAGAGTGARTGTTAGTPAPAPAPGVAAGRCPGPPGRPPAPTDSRATPCRTAKRRSRAPRSAQRPRTRSTVWARTSASSSINRRYSAGSTESSRSSSGSPSSITMREGSGGTVPRGTSVLRVVSVMPVRVTLARQLPEIRIAPPEGVVSSSGRGDCQVPSRGGGEVSASGSAAGVQIRDSTKGRQVGARSGPRSTGRSGASRPSWRVYSGAAVSTSTSAPVRSATSWATGSRSVGPAGASRAAARSGAGRADRRLAISWVGGCVPAGPVAMSRDGRSGSIGTAWPMSAACRGSSRPGPITTPAGTCSTTHPRAVMAGSAATSSSQVGAGARRPCGHGSPSGANRHQPPCGCRRPWTNSDPSGLTSTVPAGAITSSPQVREMCRAGAGRPSLSAPAPDMTSRTVSRPRSRTASSASARVGHRSG
ncbi:hypothetical protein SFUMM280S_08088 [Streptomyces fumanus]